MMRSRMTMRAFVERDAAVGDDPYGGAPAPSWQAHATLACYAWSKTRRDVVDGDKSAVVVDLRCVFPPGSDVTEADRVARIEDRQGAQLFAGPFEILTLQPRKQHLEAALERAK